MIRRVAGKDQAAALCLESFQTIQCSRTKCPALRYQNRIILHLSHSQRIATLRTKFREFSLTDIIKINRTKEQILTQGLKTLFQLFAERGGLFRGSPIEPVALNGMNDSDADNRLAARHGGIQAGKMIFYQRELIPPGRLIADGSRIIALGFSLHRHPGQMRNTDCDA